MTDLKYYEFIEEDFHSETTRSVTHKTKKKKTWKQITEVKNDREHTKKQWQKKRRKSKGESNNK